MTHGQHRRWLAVALACIPLLSACGQSNNTSDLEKFIARADQHTATTIKTLHSIPAYHPHYYRPGKKSRSPFRFDAETHSDEPVQSHASGPLEHYPLNKLEMVGMIATSVRRYAFILAPDHQVHRVTTGARIGQRRWAITAIDKTRIRLSRAAGHGENPEPQTTFISLQPG